MFYLQGTKLVLVTYLSIGQDIADEGHVGTHVCLLCSVQPLRQSYALWKQINTHEYLLSSLLLCPSSLAEAVYAMTLAD